MCPPLYSVTIAPLSILKAVSLFSVSLRVAREPLYTRVKYSSGLSKNAVRCAFISDAYIKLRFVVLSCFRLQDQHCVSW